MRSTALTTVPSTGTTPIDIDVGQQNVSAVVIHNASYRVLTLTLSDGTSRMIGAQRSDVAYVRSGAFDGHVTLTPGTLVSAQTDAGSMWLDVYLSGEQVQGTYPAPCQNGMTAGNQQPRVVTVPATPAGTYVLSGNITQGAGDLIINSGIVTTWAAAAGLSMRFYLYSHSLSILNGGMTASGQLCAVLCTLVVRQLNSVNAPVGADVFLDKTAIGYYFGGTIPIYNKPIGPAPITVSVIKAASAVSLEYAVIVHESVIQPAGTSVSVFWNAAADFDSRDAGLVTQVPGPGNQSYIAGVTTQYTGTVW